MAENMSWKSWVFAFIVACMNGYGMLSGPVAECVGHDLIADVISSGVTSWKVSLKSKEGGLIWSGVVGVRPICGEELGS